MRTLHSPIAQQNARTLAVAAMLGAVAAFALMDWAMKILAATHSPMQVVFLRGLTSLPILLAWAGRAGLGPVRGLRWPLHLLRGLLGLAMLGAFVKSLSLVSMSNAYAVYLGAPLLIALLSAPLLGEHLRPGQWLAIVVGMAGVLVALRPSGDGLLGAGGLYAGLAALSYAAIAVTTRVLGRTDGVASMTLSFVAVLTVGAGVASWPDGIAVSSGEIGWIALLGIAGAVGQLLMTVSFSLAPPATVAPFEFTALLWALAFDWLWWHVLPDAALVLGAVLIVASGLHLVRQGPARPAAGREE